MAYASYAEQTAHYFSRPHDKPLRVPLVSPAAWEAEELRSNQGWRAELTAAQIDELESALDASESTGKATRDLIADDFPLPTLAHEISRWRRALVDGRGLQVVSGVPVDRWPADRCERFFWCIGLHMGTPGAQNPQDDLLGHVMDTGDDASDPWVRLYRTRADIAFHCDAADVVGLLCLRAARQGGASRIVSSVSVYNELLARSPEGIDRLYEPFALDVRNEDRSGKLRHIPISPCRFAGDRLRTFYHSDYFRSAQRHDDVAPLRDDEQTLLDLYESIANDPRFYFDMELAPGDIQWLSNHVILHARTAYVDHDAPERKRHLLRLWLSIEN